MGKERTGKGLAWVQPDHTETCSSSDLPQGSLELGVVGLASAGVTGWRVEGISPLGAI